MSRHAKPKRPANLKTPGLNWRERDYGWVCYWIARADIVKRGYSLKPVRLWPPSESRGYIEPTPDEWNAIASNCERLQAEMLNWGKCPAPNYDPRNIYDGTVGSLIDVFQQDPDSPYVNLRTHTRRSYDSSLRSLKQHIGGAAIPGLTFRDFKRWHEGFCKPLEPGGPPRRARGHGLMTFVRIIFRFGGLLKLEGCKDAKETLSELEFPMPKKRKEFMTAEWAIAIRAEAHRRGLPSMALAQAMMFELMLRPKDVIGEWLPMSEPGVSDVVARGQKWLHGAHWKEVTPELIFTHRLSKSLRGRNATVDPTAGKTESFDLNSYPMVMEELANVTNRSGPMIIFERTGRPWDEKYFAQLWREVATAVGIPKNVQNRDSRAGGITEALDSGAIPDQVRRHAGHSLLSTTMGYSKDSIEAKNNVTKFRSQNPKRTA